MPNIYSKYFKYAQNKWDGADEPTINNVYKIDKRKF